MNMSMLRSHTRTLIIRMSIIGTATSYTKCKRRRISSTFLREHMERVIATLGQKPAAFPI